MSAADIAILHDWNSWWAGSAGRPAVPGNDHAEVVRAWHRALWEAHLTTAFAHPEHDLSRLPAGRRAPALPAHDAAIDNLVAYVRGGGTLVCGFLTGIADEDDRIRPGGMDARLRELLGIRTLHEWWPLDAGETRRRAAASAARSGPRRSSPTAPRRRRPRYRGGELDGLPAVLRKGPARYLSTLPEPAALRDTAGRGRARGGRPSRPRRTARPGSRPSAAASCSSCSTTGANR